MSYHYLIVFAFDLFYFVSFFFFFFFSSRRRHTRSLCDWSSDVCSSDLSPEDIAELKSRCAATPSDFRWPSKLPITDSPTVQSTTRKVPSPAGATSEPRSEERRVGKECRSRWST